MELDRQRFEQFYKRESSTEEGNVEDDNIAETMEDIEDIDSAQNEEIGYSSAEKENEQNNLNDDIAEYTEDKDEIVSTENEEVVGSYESGENEQNNSNSNITESMEDNEGIDATQNEETVDGNESEVNEQEDANENITENTEDVEDIDSTQDEEIIKDKEEDVEVNAYMKYAMDVAMKRKFETNKNGELEDAEEQATATIEEEENVAPMTEGEEGIGIDEEEYELWNKVKEEPEEEIAANSSEEMVVMPELPHFNGERDDDDEDENEDENDSEYPNNEFSAINEMAHSIFNGQMDTNGMEDSSEGLMETSESNVSPVKKYFLCDITSCLYKTLIEEEMNAHSEIAHGMEINIDCPKCDYKTFSKNYLFKHDKEIHKANTKKHCKTCEYSTNSWFLLNEHNKEAHNKVKDWPCPDCDYRASQKGNLTSHVKAIHERNKDLTCPDCGYKTFDQYRMGKHRESTLCKKRAMKRAENAKTKPFVCRKCNFQAGYKKVLSNHIERTHPNEEYDSDDNYQQEGAQVNGNGLYNSYIEEPISVSIKCLKCEHEETEMGEILIHIKEHHPEIKIYFCYKCRYLTEKRFRLMRHQETQLCQKRRKLPAQKPQIQNSSLASIVSKRKVDLGGAVIAPVHFLLNTNSSSDETTDINNNIKEEPEEEEQEIHKCQLCPFEAKIKKVFRKHVRSSHSKADFLTCQQCSYLGTGKNDLKRHMKNEHDVGRTKHTCDDCSYTTVHSHSMKLHRRAKHEKIKDYFCQLCDYGATQKGNLKAHMMKFHPDDN